MLSSRSPFFNIIYPQADNSFHHLLDLLALPLGSWTLCCSLLLPGCCARTVRWSLSLCLSPLSEVWARVPCPLSSVVTAGPRPPPAHRLREGGGSFEHRPIITPVLSNNIKRQILTSSENINYLGCETRGGPIVLHAVVNILFIFASKLACQKTASIYLDLICFVLRKEFEN